ncbi:MAG: hypothetical protein PVI60_09905, partial [Desulfobacteraceae bacterium]
MQRQGLQLLRLWLMFAVWPMSNISRALPKHLAAGAIMRIKNLFTYWTNQAFSPGAVLKEKYAAFKSLLAYDKQAHDLMAELEEIYHEQIRVDFSVIEKKYTAL